MEILSLNFFTLALAGLWKPRDWTGVKALLYHFYTAVVIFVNGSFFFSGAMDFELANNDVVSIIHDFSLLLCLITVNEKIVCAVWSRKYIKDVVDTLGCSPFKPESKEEQDIVQRYDNFTRNIIKYYQLSFAIGLVWYSVGYLSLISPTEVLPYSGWFPYSYNSTSIYWVTAVYQLYAISSATAVNFAFDPLLPCVICHMCAQVQILRLKFNVMIKKLEIITGTHPTDVAIVVERKMVGKWVSNHIELLNLINYVNDIWSKVIFVQYTASSLILCTAAYVLSHMDISMNFVGNFFYFMAMSFQIFFQCYCANHMTLEFLDLTVGLYDTNWFNLSNSLRRSVTIILSETFRPVIFTSNYFVILSLDSYIKLVKCAYTVYNVLQ